MKRAIAIVFALLATLTAGTVLAGDGGFLTTLLNRPDEARGTVIVPDRFLRSWDPVTVFFSTPRGPSDGGPEDDPDRFLLDKPDHPGAWTWLDSRTLQFRPAEPWTPLETLSFETQGARADVSTLLRPPTRVTPSRGSTELPPVDQIQLSFPDAVTPELLARIATIEVTPLDGGGTRVLDQADFEVKAFERSASRHRGRTSEARFVILLNTPIPRGHRATLRLRLSVDDDAAEALDTVTFSTARPFRLTQMGCRGATVPVATDGARWPADAALSCNSSPEVRLTFSAPLGQVGAVLGQNLVQLDPAVDDVTYRVDGRQLVVSGDFQRETPYRVTVMPSAVVDTDGRSLELSGPAQAWVRFPALNDFLSWGSGSRVLERKGPRMLPVSGRGHARADLRIHRIDPLDPNLWPFPSSPVTVNESARPPGPGEARTDLVDGKRPDKRFLTERLQTLGTPGVSTVVDLPIASRGASFGLDISEHLTALSGDNAPGTYLVGLRSLKSGAERDWVRIQVTDLALTTVEQEDRITFRVTSLDTGAPLSGTQVRIDGHHTSPDGTVYEALWTGTTGADGTVDFRAPFYTDHHRYRADRVVLSRGEDRLVIDATQPPERWTGGSWAARGSDWIDWAWQRRDNRKPSTHTLAHLFTERPVYRPEHPVHIKGWTRHRSRGRLTDGPDVKHVVVSSPGGDTWRLDPTRSEAGSFHVTWDQSDIATGTYRVWAETAGGRSLGSTTFEVRAYEVPRFEVRMHGEDVVPLDQPFEVDLTAAFYAGGGVGGQPVRWRVTQVPSPWSPPSQEGLLFSSDGRWSSHETFRSTAAVVRDNTTDSSGGASLLLDPSVEPTAQPREYIVEATVTGPSGQTVTETRRVRAVPGYVLGADIPRYLEDASGIPLTIGAVALDGSLREGVEVTARLERREWHAHLQESDFRRGEARYVTDTVDVPVSEQTLTTGAALSKLLLPVDRAGVYIVTLESTDALGRRQSLAVDLFISGSEAVSWERPEEGTFAVTADKSSYAPGDTAHLVLRSPWQDARALIVLEDPDSMRVWEARVRGGQATIDIPVETGWVPKIPVHVLLQRGRDDRAGRPDAGLDLGKPDSLAATTWLTVNPVENTVNVTLDHPERALPGQTVDVTVTLADPSGKPVSGDVTLWLVDRAVLALGKESRLDPKPDFIRSRQSTAVIRDSRRDLVGRLPTRFMPGGDGGEDEEGLGLLDNVTVRRNFKPVPIWLPAVKVGPSGRTTVKVELPDNLTVFAVRAKAASGPERFGFAKGQIAVRLPLVVQPSLPRFVRPGDQFEATAIGRVVEGDGGAGRAEVKAEGLVLSGAKARDLAWTVGEAQRIAFPVSVPTPELNKQGRLVRSSVDLTFGVSRQSDGAADAFQVTLPLHDDRGPTWRRTLVGLEPNTPVTLEALPDEPRAGTVSRTVVASDDPALIALTSAAQSLALPAGTTLTERIARSRLLILASQSNVPFGVIDAEAMAKVEVAQTLAALADHSTERGLVSTWPGGIGRVWVSADALHLMAEASAAGFDVDSELQQTLVRSLKQGLRSDYTSLISGAAWYERTRSLQALAAAGELDAAYWSELARSSNNLSLEAQARVVLAGRTGGGAPAQLEQRLVDGLSASVTTRLHQGAERYNGLTDRSSLSRLVWPSELRTLASVSSALTVARPQDSKTRIATDALVERAGPGGWDNAQTNLAGWLALGERLNRSGPTVTLSLDGDTAQLGDRRVATWTRTDAAAMVLQLGDGAPAANALVTERWVPAQPGSEMDPLADGFVVTRHLTVVTGDAPRQHPLTEGGGTLKLREGDIVEEHIQLVVPAERYFVELTVPLAAGMEPLDPGLATAPPEAAPSAGPTRRPDWTAMRDDRVVFAYERLPAGTYDLRFRTRARVVGTFVQPPATAVLAVDATVHGRSAGTWVEVE